MARAAGVDTVLSTPSTVDLWSSKVVRAGMGAHFHLNLCRGADLPELLGRELWLATAGEGEPYWNVDWSQPSALIVGSEAHGATPATAAANPRRVTIRMAEGVESLNAAIAAGIPAIRGPATALAPVRTEPLAALAPGAHWDWPSCRRSCT
jgi:TrmH family RNA methyltransferase